MKGAVDAACVFTALVVFIAGVARAFERLTDLRLSPYISRPLGLNPPYTSMPPRTNQDIENHDTGRSESSPPPNEHIPVQGRPLEVKVDERGVERAIRKLRRLMASEGVLREIKRRRHYEKPSVKSKRKLREAERRRKRRQRKRMPMRGE